MPSTDIDWRNHSLFGGDAKDYDDFLEKTSGLRPRATGDPEAMVKQVQDAIKFDRVAYEMLNGDQQSMELYDALHKDINEMALAYARRGEQMSPTIYQMFEDTYASQYSFVKNPEFFGAIKRNIVAKDVPYSSRYKSLFDLNTGKALAGGEVGNLPSVLQPDDVLPQWERVYRPVPEGAPEGKFLPANDKGVLQKEEEIQREMDNFIDDYFSELRETDPQLLYKIEPFDRANPPETAYSKLVDSLKETSAARAEQMRIVEREYQDSRLFLMELRVKQQRMLLEKLRIMEPLAQFQFAQAGAMMNEAKLAEGAALDSEAFRHITQSGLYTDQEINALLYGPRLPKEFQAAFRNGETYYDLVRGLAQAENASRLDHWDENLDGYLQTIPEEEELHFRPEIPDRPPVPQFPSAAEFYKNELDTFNSAGKKYISNIAQEVETDLKSLETVYADLHSTIQTLEQSQSMKLRIKHWVEFVSDVADGAWEAMQGQEDFAELVANGLDKEHWERAIRKTWGSAFDDEESFMPSREQKTPAQIREEMLRRKAKFEQQFGITKAGAEQTAEQFAENVERFREKVRVLVPEIQLPKGVYAALQRQLAAAWEYATLENAKPLINFAKMLAEPYFEGTILAPISLALKIQRSGDQLLKSYKVMSKGISIARNGYKSIFIRASDAEEFEALFAEARQITEEITGGARTKMVEDLEEIYKKIEDARQSMIGPFVSGAEKATFADGLNALSELEWAQISEKLTPTARYMAKVTGATMDVAKALGTTGANLEYMPIFLSTTDIGAFFTALGGVKPFVLARVTWLAELVLGAEAMEAVGAAIFAASIPITEGLSLLFSIELMETVEIVKSIVELVKHFNFYQYLDGLAKMSTLGFSRDTPSSMMERYPERTKVVGPAKDDDPEWLIALEANDNHTVLNFWGQKYIDFYKKVKKTVAVDYQPIKDVKPEWVVHGKYIDPFALLPYETQEMVEISKLKEEQIREGIADPGYTLVNWEYPIPDPKTTELIRNLAIFPGLNNVESWPDPEGQVMVEGDEWDPKTMDFRLVHFFNYLAETGTYGPMYNNAPTKEKANISAQENVKDLERWKTMVLDPVTEAFYQDQFYQSQKGKRVLYQMMYADASAKHFHETEWNLDFPVPKDILGWVMWDPFAESLYKYWKTYGRLPLARVLLEPQNYYSSTNDADVGGAGKMRDLAPSTTSWYFGLFDRGYDQWIKDKYNDPDWNTPFKYIFDQGSNPPKVDVMLTMQEVDDMLQNTLDIGWQTRPYVNLEEGDYTTDLRVALRRGVAPSLDPIFVGFYYGAWISQVIDLTLVRPRHELNAWRALPNEQKQAQLTNLFIETEKKRKRTTWDYIVFHKEQFMQQLIMTVNMLYNNERQKIWDEYEEELATRTSNRWGNRFYRVYWAAKLCSLAFKGTLRKQELDDTITRFSGGILEDIYISTDTKEHIAAWLQEGIAIIVTGKGIELKDFAGQVVCRIIVTKDPMCIFVIFKGTTSVFDWSFNVDISAATLLRRNDFTLERFGAPGNLESFPEEEALFGENAMLVHNGFLRAWEAIRHHVLEKVSSLYTKYQQEIHEVAVCGHSLGGAIASLAVMEMPLMPNGQQPSLYQFAPPMVGDLRYRANCIDSCYDSECVYHDGDPVNSLPPFLVPNKAQTQTGWRLWMTRIRAQFEDPYKPTNYLEYVGMFTSYLAQYTGMPHLTLGGLIDPSKYQKKDGSFTWAPVIKNIVIISNLLNNFAPYRGAASYIRIDQNAPLGYEMLDRDPQHSEASLAVMMRAISLPSQTRSIHSIEAITRSLEVIAASHPDLKSIDDPGLPKWFRDKVPPAKPDKLPKGELHETAISLNMD